VAIARALVAEPAVLLMDEPLSNLDAKLREQMRVELRALQQRLAITTLYVTHDQEEAMVLSDQVAVMHAGRLLQVAPPEIIYTRPANRTVAAFVGMPNLLAAKVREITGGLVRVDGDGWDGWCAGPAALQPGDAVTVIVRPEAIQLAREPRAAPGPGLAWSGAVIQRFFRGTRHLYTVQAAAHRFQVDAPPDQSFSPGAAVTLSVAAAHTWAVRE
jgi:iron(III) transport system ATP-binding protein